MQTHIASLITASIAVKQKMLDEQALIPVIEQVIEAVTMHFNKGIRYCFVAMGVAQQMRNT